MRHHVIKDRMLRALRPGMESEPPTRWQQRKSAQTRLKVLEAAVDCLVENGYIGLTTAAVAERCQLSRGAMHHHFATRVHLVSAVVEHVFYQRMHNFLDNYFEALPARGGDALVEIANDAHWQSVQTREYAAYLQLAVAARTDAELAEHFMPAARRYDEIWDAEMIEAFPRLAAQWEAMKLANDFALTMHMGMLVHYPVFGSDRTEKLRLLAGKVIGSLYEPRTDSADCGGT